MSNSTVPTPTTPGTPATPATTPLNATNDAIRDLVDAGAGGEWPAEEYEVLLIQWNAAIRGEIEIVEAA